MARILVVGSTGILAPAAHMLRTAGHEVIGVSSRGGEGSLAVDARDGRALATALEGRSWDSALVYGPAVSDSSLAFLRAGTTERCVVVRTSGAADPALGILVVPRDTLQLGWTGEPPRWHTPHEVSQAALEVLSDGVPRTLGLVRPWSDRP